MNAKYGYPDLLDSEKVFEGLLGYGMFSNLMPPCFTSESFFIAVQNKELKFPKRSVSHSYIDYKASRNTDVPRLLAIPHPESYWKLCKCIEKNWLNINKQIGKPENKINFCHVKNIKGKKIIFEMNYKGTDKWEEENMHIEYASGCRYIVSADIATCFPSMYSHSIVWSVKGKDWAKENRKSTEWPNELDKYCRNIKDGETNGLLIGPHTSNIISEIILTTIDCELYGHKFTRIIRHIDDYKYYATDYNDAKKFIRRLSIELKKFELLLNNKKTKIIPSEESISNKWIFSINQFMFPDIRPEIGFTSVNSYINYAFHLAKENTNYAVLNYAIKVISGKKLSKRAKKLYVKKILQISLSKPYILPILEKYVFDCFVDKDYQFLKSFFEPMLKIALQSGSTDALAFLFYYAIKYKHTIPYLTKKKVDLIISLNDCISMTLAYIYVKSKKSDLVNAFQAEAKRINDLSNREKDKFWLFLYEVLDHKDLSDFFKSLKDKKISFVKIDEY